MIDHAFIERKRATIAQIERDATTLPNPFLGLTPRQAKRVRMLAPFSVELAKAALTHAEPTKTRKAYMRKR